ncbi:hypothetical protein DV096_17015 [Bradymonadaceae bacterium TMQ3]|nr:hypothetical protein DV096_17015 [Bradymonadaceae bacterium TMQ3]TXC69410.1 hypothetical protein FRC91_17595 [Bradymonadales bacterium TMQ1]
MNTRAVKLTLSALAAITLVSACGPSTTRAFDAMSATEVQNLRRAGESSGSLKVEVKVEAEARHANASSAQDFETEIEVRVSRQGVPVTDARVVIAAYELGEWTLEHDEDGEYEHEIDGYHRAYRVDVIAGADRVEGVYLAGPALHTFDAPTQGAQVPGDQPLDVSWQAESGADEVWIEGEGFEDVRLDATASSYQVAPEQLDREPHEREDNEIEVLRLNRMSIEGAEAGSQMSVSVSNEVEVWVAPTAP